MHKFDARGLLTIGAVGISWLVLIGAIALFAVLYADAAASTAQASLQLANATSALGARPLTVVGFRANPSLLAASPSSLPHALACISLSLSDRPTHVPCVCVLSHQMPTTPSP